jgi:hypothetical protein
MGKTIKDVLIGVNNLTIKKNWIGYQRREPEQGALL